MLHCVVLHAVAWQTGHSLRPPHAAPLCAGLSAVRATEAATATATESVLTDSLPAAPAPASPPAAAPPPAPVSAACKLHHVEAGSRLPSKEPPVVLLHGLFGEGKNFQSWAKGLFEKNIPTRRIVLVDLRNHGSSPQMPSMSYREMAADVVALLDELGIDEACLCGHSVGGKVAMAVSLLYSERVERLLVLDMAPVVYDPADCKAWAEIYEVVAALKGLDLTQVVAKKDADRLLTAAIPAADMRAFAMTNLVRQSGGGFRWRVNLPSIEASLPILAGWGEGPDEGLDELSYHRNTLFVGSTSRFVRTEHLPEMSRQFSRYSVTKIRNAAHWIHADAPGPLQIVAANFLAAPAA